MMDSLEFAKYITDNRLRLNWKVTKLAREMGLDRKTINNWEEGNALKVKIDKYYPVLEEIFRKDYATDDKSDRKEIRDFIKHMRNAVGWNTEQLANAIGYAEVTVGILERNGYSKKVDTQQVERNIRKAVKEEIISRRNFQKV